MPELFETLAKLPPMIASRSPTTNEPIYIKRGEMGFYYAPKTLDPDAFNAPLKITDRQRAAMQFGSMFGWHVPAADPDTWTDEDAAAVMKPRA